MQFNIVGAKEFVPANLTLDILLSQMYPSHVPGHDALLWVNFGAIRTLYLQLLHAMYVG